MPKQKKSPSIFLKFSWWSAIITGAVIGILSQRIPEIKSQTDKIVKPIEKSKYFKELKSTIASHFHKEGDFIALEEPPFSYSHYSEEKSRAAQPVSSFIIHRSGYSLAYDARTRNPAWVYEHLTADNIKGGAERSHFNFKEDDTLPQHLRTTLADYRGYGLDQGHMAPAADHRSSPQAMSDTFYLTNMCPQCPQFNREYWAKLEKHVRDLTEYHPHIYVITGPLYLPYNEGKRRFVKYEVIGGNDVAVPSHFFKVILLEDREGNKEIEAYMMPNTFIPPNTPLDNFRTTTQKVEKAAGVLLFNQS